MAGAPAAVATTRHSSASGGHSSCGSTCAEFFQEVTPTKGRVGCRWRRSRRLRRLEQSFRNCRGLSGAGCPMKNTVTRTGSPLAQRLVIARSARQQSARRPSARWWEMGSSPLLET